MKCLPSQKPCFSNTSQTIVKGILFIFILNSKIFFYAVKKFYGGGVLGEHGIRMKHTFFGNFPCPQYNEEIENIAKELTYKYDNDLSQRLEDILSIIYSFTEEEVSVIQNDTI